MGIVSVNRILDLFQECRMNRQIAQCFLETRDGEVTATFSMRCKNEKKRSAEEKPHRRITPFRRRRNLKTREAWLERKQESKAPPTFSFSKPADENSPHSDESVETFEDENNRGPVWKENLEEAAVDEDHSKIIDEIRICDFSPSK